jgi:hypothetical protein
MNILPGFRELRAPLAAGYMWLITAWLWLDHFQLIPMSRPAGNGWLAHLWSIGIALRIGTLLAILTFVAYLIGSFLEIDIDSLKLRKVIPPIVRRRPKYQFVRESPRVFLRPGNRPPRALKLLDWWARTLGWKVHDLKPPLRPDESIKLSRAEHELLSEIGMGS